MIRKYISQFGSGDVIDSIFLVQRKELRTTKNGSLYIQTQLADRTGVIDARMWDASSHFFESLADESFLRVKGKTEIYQNRMQLIIISLAKIDQSEIKLADYLPSTKRNVNDMFAELKTIVNTIKQPHLKKFVTIFFEDKELCKKFCTAPAAVQYHHAFLGGLLEHTLSVAQLGVKIAPLYPNLNRDLLICGILFHDIGKVTELCYDRNLHYSDEGQLVGHLISGIQIVDEKAKLIEGFPKTLLDLLKHMILSHHGEYEWGSPKLPMTVEALTLHYLDNLDAKIHAFNKAIANDKDTKDNWTGFNKMFERKLFKKSSDYVD
ncbi:MAG: HD family phosphohydrolase [Candidatus Scalindua sp.]|nr:HD domain-containing protein [Planctomycetota bacterium]RZV70576.1 MAG: HD domain-containing protein [Candidatus Scalindua sp. SCAELEC01]GJQ60467.1 MAG: HD family phosphohydrolase [Candidatus Scalindua sp.]